MTRASVIKAAIGPAVAAGALALLTACGSGATVDTSDIPLVRPAALTAKDGTEVPLPAQVADTGTPSQRDRYAAQVLVPTKLSVHVPAAEQACTMLNGGMPMKDAVGRVAAGEKLEKANAERVVYAGALSWCPKFRAPFDALALGGASTSTSTTTSPSKSTGSSKSSRSSSSSDSTDSTTGSSSSTKSRSDGSN